MRDIWMALFCLSEHGGDYGRVLPCLMNSSTGESLNSIRTKRISEKSRTEWTDWGHSLMNTGPPCVADRAKGITVSGVRGFMSRPVGMG